MKYSPEFLETNARLKTLDEETLNDELNKMTADELLAHGDYMIQQTLEEKDLLSEEEAQAHINELLQLTREPSEDEREPIKVHTHRTAKRILILAAAILILISVFMVAAVASKRDFSILNGVVKFDNGKVYVNFSKKIAEPKLTLAELEMDLKEHGFVDIRLPNYFQDKRWEYQDLSYPIQDKIKQVCFSVSDNHIVFSVNIVIYLNTDSLRDTFFKGVEGGKTIQQGDNSTYVFDHGDGRCEMLYYIKDEMYRIIGRISNEEMSEIAKTVF